MKPDHRLLVSLSCVAAAVAAREPGAKGTPASNDAPAAWVGGGTIDGWQAFSARAADGVETPAFWVAPGGRGPFPVLLFLHGAPGGVGEAGLRRLLGSPRWARLVAEGFAVCLADYRGHAENRPFDVIKGDFNATDDLAAVVNFLGTQRALDLRRLVLAGQSLGGLIALEAVSRGRVAPAALVASAPATFPFLGYRGGRGGRPDRDLGDHEIDRAASLTRVRTIDAPTLIVQGTADGLCALNKKLFEVMQAAGKDVRLELFAGAPHGFVNGPDNADFRRALDLLVAFARQHTAPPAASHSTRP